MECAVTHDRACAFYASLPYDDYLKTIHWQDVRARALLKDPCCVICGGADCLQIHHTTYENLGYESDTDVITLCASCHERIEKTKGFYGEAVKGQYDHILHQFQEAIDKNTAWVPQDLFDFKRTIATYSAQVFLRFKESTPSFQKRNTVRIMHIIYKAITHLIPARRRNILIPNMRDGYLFSALRDLKESKGAPT